MIWTGGAILPDDALTIPATDRTFEHGLGLFETFRTWGGRPTLLEHHRARMLRSAAELGLPLDPATWPDPAAVARLLEAEAIGGDRMLRITATGGTESAPSVVWMRSSPLPPPTRPGGAILCLNAWAIPSSSPLPAGEGPGVRDVASPTTPENALRSDHPPADFTARHKTLNYWFNRRAHEQARALGYDETLLHAPPWGYAEASRSNLFLVIDATLMTIATAAPIVPGIMRRLVLDLAGESGLDPREVPTIDPHHLAGAAELFLTNAVRGIIPVARVDAPGGPIDRPAPGPWTATLQAAIARRLWPEEEAPRP